MREMIMAGACALLLGAAGCAKGDAGAACPPVVEKLMTLGKPADATAEAARKRLTEACEKMDRPMRTCIAAAKTKEELEACSKGPKSP